ncbi:hypothetical protein E2C01_044925 [Portunus trituberculatus]|uniref:Uncharacterized protein n=1 Tax=Portunus trituberculatus TaxID=210409 RepID=A0A5B7G0F5_PORTR|nr:hypothetical protein [Portunus trituberculatus]
MGRVGGSALRACIGQQWAGVFRMAFIAVALNLVYSSNTQSPSTFPSDLKSCLLLQFDMATPSSILCAASCARHSSCNFFCLYDLECLLFSAIVSYEWQGSLDTDAVTFTRCYTTFGMDDNIATGGVVNSSITAVYSDPWWAADGYFCLSMLHCFNSIKGVEPWWQVSYQEEKVVVQVIVQQHPLFRLPIKVCIGNEQSSDYNPSVGPLDPPESGLLVFDLQPPLVGRIITIVGTPGPGILSVCHFVVNELHPE